MIHQFSATFDQKQDRILFCFNTKEEKEFRFWLTRRNIINFLETMPRHSDQSKKIITDIEKSASLRKKILNNEADKTDLLQKEATKYTPKIPEKLQTFEEKKTPMSEFKTGKIFPIGQEAILVKEIHCKLVNKVQELSFYLDNNQKVSFALSLDTFLSLHSLLELTAQKADWNIQNQSYSAKIAKEMLN